MGGERSLARADRGGRTTLRGAATRGTVRVSARGASYDPQRVGEAWRRAWPNVRKRTRTIFGPATCEVRMPRDERDQTGNRTGRLSARLGQTQCLNCGRPLTPEDLVFTTVQPVTRKVRWHRRRLATCSDACTVAVTRSRLEAQERRRPPKPPPPNTRVRRFLVWLLEHHRRHS